MSDLRDNIKTIEFPNTYSGEVLDKILTLTAEGNDTYRQGLIHVETDITYKLHLPTATIGNVIQNDSSNPDLSAGASKDGLNQITITERVLEPQRFMVFMTWDPEDMASYWKPFKPRKNLLFRELDPTVQADFIDLILEQKNTEIGTAIWEGVKGGTSALPEGYKVPEGAKELGVGNANTYFDGVMARILRASTKTAEGVDKINVVGTTKLDTGEAVSKAFNAIYRQVSNALRPHLQTMQFVVSWDTWLQYSDWASAHEYKFTDQSRENVMKYRGIKVTPVNGCPDHTVILGRFSNDVKSNLWMGIDWAKPKDESVLKIGDVNNTGELKFVKARMKADVNIVNPCEMYVHTAYADGVVGKGEEGGEGGE